MANKTKQPEKSIERIFLGRVEEQKRFQAMVTDFNNLSGKESFPCVVLISGEAGMGKTALLRRFQDIVQNDDQFSNRFQMMSVDWADERKKSPGLQVARDHIDAELVFRALHNEAIRRKWGRQFSAYNKAIKERQAVDKKVAEVITAANQDEELAVLRRAGVPAIAKIVRWRAPYIGEAGEELVESLLSVGVQVAAEQLTHLNSRLQMHLQAHLKPNHFDYFLNPDEQLAHQLARGISNVAKSKRLIVFLDSYEIVDRTDIWIRSVIREAGPRVMWVISGRNSLVESRQFGDEYFKGYADDWPRNLLPISMWPLSQTDIGDYFEMKGEPLKTAEVEALSRVTRGRPLAIYEAAAVIRSGTPLDQVLNDLSSVNGSDQIMRRMTERYLQHVVREEDRRALYALVLANGDIDALKVMLKPPNKKRINLNQLLRRLERDYGTVLADQAEVLAEPANFILEYLKGEVRRKSAEVQDLVASGIQANWEMLEKVERDLDLIEERCNEDNWVNAAVNLARNLLWQEERQAWQWILPRYLEGMIYNDNLALALLSVLKAWADQLSDGGRAIFESLLLLENKLLTIEDEQEILETLNQMAERGWLNGDSQDSGNGERQALLNLWSGEIALKQQRYEEARNRLIQVEAGLPEKGSMLKERLGEQLGQLARVLISPLSGEGQSGEPTYSPIAEELLQKIVAWQPDAHWAWLELGLVYELGGKLPKALSAFQTAVELNRKHDYTQLKVADLLAALGRHDEAIAAYEQAGKLKSGFAAPRVGLGNVYRAQGDLSRAEKFYKRALKLDPGSVDAYIQLGELYSAQGKLEEAEEAYGHAQTIRPMSGATDAGRAEILHQQGLVDEAFEAYQMALEKGEASCAIYLGLGDIYTEQGDIHKAVEAYQKGSALDPNAPQPYDRLGVLYHQLNRIEEAKALFNEAIQRDPHYVDAFHHLAELHRSVDNLEEATEIYAQVENEMGDSFTLYKQAEANLQLRRFDEAIRTYEKILESGPPTAEAFIGMGRAYTHLGELDAADDAFAKALELDITLPQNYIGMAWIQLRRGNSETAEQTFEQALALDSQDQTARRAARLGLGEVRLSQSRFAEAKLIFDEIWQADRDEIEALIGLGRVAIGERAYREALDIWQQGLSMQRNHPAIHTGIGQVRYQQQRYGQGVRAFERAIELDPHYALAHLGLGETYHALGNGEAALAAFERARALDPTVRISPVHLGDVYAQLGRYSEALDAYESAVATGAAEVINSPLMHVGLGNVYRRLSRLDEATRAYQTALKHDPYHLAAQIGLGHVHIALNHYPDALRSFNEVLQLKADHVDAYIGLGDVYSRMGQLGRAIEAYQNGIKRDRRNPVPYIGLAKVYRAQGDLLMAEKVVRESMLGGQESCEGCVLMGDIACGLQQHEVALRYYERALGLDDGCSAAYGGLGNVYLALDRPTMALTYYERGLECDDLDERFPYAQLGRLYHESGRLDEAATIYKMGETLGPPSTDLTVAGADLLSDQGELEAAQTVYEEVLRGNLDNPDAYHGLGRIYLRQGRYEQAIKSLQQALHLGRRDVGLLVDLADAYRGANRHDFAERYYEKGINVDPSEARAHLGLGLIYQARGEMDKALYHLAMAKDLDPQTDAVDLHQGEVLLQSGRPADAETHFGAALQKEPENVEALLGLADAAVAKGHDERALEALQSALRLAPNNPQVLFKLGEIYARKNKIDHARQMFAEVCRLRPNWADAQRRHGDLLFQAEAYDEALLAYQQGLETAAEDARIWTGLGATLGRIGLDNEAVTHLRRSLELERESVPTLEALAEAYLRLGNQAAALDTYGQLSTLRPEVGPYHLAQGQLLQETGQIAQSVAAFEAALQQDDKLIAAYRGMGDGYVALGEIEKGRAAYQEILEQEGSGHLERAVALTGIARIEQRLGRESAESLFERAVAVDPNYAPAHLALGQLRLARKETAGARQAFADALRITPTDPEALTGWADLDLIEHKIEPALEHYAKAFEADETFVPALIGQGEALLAAKRPGEAGQRLQRAEELIRKQKSDPKRPVTGQKGENRDLIEEMNRIQLIVQTISSAAPESDWAMSPYSKGMPKRRCASSAPPFRSGRVTRSATTGWPVRCCCSTGRKRPSRSTTWRSTSIRSEPTRPTFMPDWGRWPRRKGSMSRRSISISRRSTSTAAGRRSSLHSASSISARETKRRR